MKKNNEKGILLIALGHHNYGRMALNLAVSIKNTCPDIPICLVYSTGAIKHLSPENIERFFSSVVEAPESSYVVAGKNLYMRAKTHIYDFSPFKETLYLDVDMIWSQHMPVTRLFDELSESDFTMISEGHLDMASGKGEINPKYTFWADLEKIKEAWSDSPKFKSGKLYQFRSEMIYFKKVKKNKEFFDLAKQIYDEPRVDVIQIGAGNSDEYAFNIASCLLHHYPHKEKYCPFYWHYIHQGLRIKQTELLHTFYAVSIGGNILPAETKELYNNLAQMHFSRMGISGPYIAKAKRDFLPERLKL